MMLYYLAFRIEICIGMGILLSIVLLGLFGIAVGMYPEEFNERDVILAEHSVSLSDTQIAWNQNIT